jgi:hypothetical protein
MPDFTELFAEFGVKDEKSLTELLENDNICSLQCVCCLENVDISRVVFIDGDPYCLSCAGQDGELFEDE